MALSHTTKLYAVQAGYIYKLLADPAVAPAAPAAPAAPTLGGAGATGGTSTVGYALVLTNGVDSVASTTTTVTVASGPTAAAPITITAAVAPAANQRMIVRRMTGGVTQGVIGYIEGGNTVLTDTGQAGTTYVANTSGILYGPGIRVPGMKDVAVTPSIKEVVLLGDYAVLDTDAFPQGLKFDVTHAKINFDAQSAMLGATVTDTGTTPNQATTLSYGSANKFPFFKFEAQAVSVDEPLGDAHLVFWKAKLASYKFGLKEADYETFDFTANAVSRINDGRWFDIVKNETTVAIAA